MEAAMRVLLVDSAVEASFVRPNLNLHRQGDAVRVNSMSDLELVVSRAIPAIDLVVVYQDRPKQLAQSTVLQILSASPLTRIVQVLGPWCDGDLRTPGRLSGLVSISSREAAWRLAEMVEQFRLGKGALVRPLTAPEPPNEIMRSRDQPPALRVGIGFKGRLAEGVFASLAALGHLPLRSGGNQADPDIDVMLMDGDSSPSKPTSVPFLRFHGFPRNTATNALAKTYSLAELEAALRRVTSSVGIQKPPSSQ
jgi:hypothetical protein